MHPITTTGQKRSVACSGLGHNKAWGWTVGERIASHLRTAGPGHCTIKHRVSKHHVPPLQRTEGACLFPRDRRERNGNTSDHPAAVHIYLQHKARTVMTAGKSFRVSQSQSVVPAAAHYHSNLHVACLRVSHPAAQLHQASGCRKG